jgi:cation:H+ antiporter
MMVLAALMVEAFAIGGTISWLEGAALLVLSGLYLTLSVRVESKGAQTIESEELVDATTLPTLWASVAKVFLSLCLLGGGSQLVIFGSVGLARAAGLSELVIGLTIVAVGTSLPEIVTSIAAACRGKSDLAVGNIVGSNILNVFVILGLSSVLAPQGLQVPEAAIMFDIPVMIGVSVAAIPIFWLGRTVSRLDALILCIGYVLYVVALLR